MWGFQHWNPDQNCDIYFLLPLMTFLVTLTSQCVLPLAMPGCLDHLAYALATIKMKTCNPSTWETWTFYIGLNDHVPDEYFLDGIQKHWLHLNLTISILWEQVKLNYHMFSGFRVICKKPFHKIRQRTVVLTWYSSSTNYLVTWLANLQVW